MGTEQLERDFLEHKEKDELYVIAQAMSLKPGPKIRKADLVDLILNAANTGTETKVAVPEVVASENGATADTTVDVVSFTGNINSANGSDSETKADSEAKVGTSAASTVTSDTTDVEGADSVEDASNTVANDAYATSQQPTSNAVPNSTLNSSHRNRRRKGRDRGKTGEARATEEAYTGELAAIQGILDLRDEGYGFLRASGYLPSPQDVYVSVSQIRRFELRKGDYIEGGSRPPINNEKYPALVRIDTINGLDPELTKNRPNFDKLTPLFPDSRLRLEVIGDSNNTTSRIIDLLSPLGKGQRGMIVSPPKAGKTTIMKQIANSIETNHPEVYLMVLLVDERPEEVTDMRRSVKGEVVASTFDRPIDEHTAVAELAIEKAKRLVEVGRDVVIILDGITRLARAYNLAQPATGRVMTGGVDSAALYPPKKFFGSARNIEEGGSLTILATALVETGSKMDEVIFEEFKGTGNMELRLDRKLAERRIYPAIDVNASSTRHEELLFERNQLQQVWKLRRVLSGLVNDDGTSPGLELLMDKIKVTKSNDEFLAEIAKGPS
ncbi:MAG: transcription termination factor Rho [Actinobacteria bacterium]|nr:transcription termination factor Rho [Actinomycetota bacterium]MCL6104769.1 transcription termination factor Rho [Actinomycetota bacterium]